MEEQKCKTINDLKSIETHPNKKLVSKIDQSINQIIENEGFSEFNISKKRISSKVNYIGQLYEIDVKGKVATDDKELNIFVKKIISNPESVKIFSVSDMYKTELFVYKELFTIFEKLQDEANVPSEERYKTIKAYEQSNAEMLLMENISKKGFQTSNRMDVPSLKFIELSFRNIARFHGLSFVLKQRQPEYFNEKLKRLKYPVIFEDEMKEVIRNTCDLTVRQLGEDLKEKVVELYTNLDKKLVEYLNDETIKTCLCHGDYTLNNIMMREEDGEIQEVIAIDYQTVYYACPVFDLLYMIYLSTDRDFRKSHLSELKDMYYETLRNFMKYFNLDAESVYPRKEFERVFTEKIDYGLFIALEFLPVIFVSEEDIPELQQWNKYFPVDNKMKARIQGIIEDFVELGFI